ncbi:MAG: VWA domain-containing protein [Pirellulales bacterium]
MQFANSIMLSGLAAALIPIALHLFTQHRAKRMEWGAMQFLTASAVHRNRKMLIEQMLLLIVRCLTLALLALAMALPFFPPDSRAAWPVALPLVLLGVAVLGAGAALGAYRAWRWGLFALGTMLLVGAVGLIVVEQPAESPLLARSGGSDVAIVIDGSESMQIAVDGVANFDRAVDEARRVIESLGHGDAASVVVAGDRSLKVIASPVSRGEQIKEKLDNLAPVGGTMTVSSALFAAAETLTRGANPAKKIVLITDGQSAGWEADGEVNWEILREAVGELQPTPLLLVRKLPLPARVNNLQVAEVNIPDVVAAPDQDLPIDVLIRNTGTEAVLKPVEIEVSIDGGQELLRGTVRKLEPGAAETVRFRHRFEQRGLHTVTANLAYADDLSWDNRAERVVTVFNQLPVLLVNGNSATRWQDRATSYLEAALTPDADAPGQTEPAGAFAEPAIVDAWQLSTIENLHEYRAVVLADVAKLPGNVAMDLAEYVAEGGALLIAPGGRGDPEFYNAWRAVDSRPLLPARLESRRLAPAVGGGVRPAISSFDHPALKLLAANPDSDFSAVGLTAYWGLRAHGGDSAVRVCGAFDTGEPLLVERKLGKGRVLLTAMSLDGDGGNLPAKQSFLPFVQEMIKYAMQLPSYNLEFNAPGARSVTLPLDSGPRKSEDGVPTEPPPSVAVLVTPDGSKSEAALTVTADEVRADFSPLASPGLYRLELPEALQASFGGLLLDGAVPLVVHASPQESRLDVLSDDQLAAGGEIMPISAAPSLEELLAAISGETSGHQFWKTLALAALLLMIAEIALARWIAVQRRVGGGHAAGLSRPRESLSESSASRHPRHAPSEVTIG